jgi:O-acetyl-ADP-ribose deacetylase (regulator of RNase III)
VRFLAYPDVPQTSPTGVVNEPKTTDQGPAKTVKTETCSRSLGSFLGVICGVLCYVPYKIFSFLAQAFSSKLVNPTLPAQGGAEEGDAKAQKMDPPGIIQGCVPLEQIPSQGQSSLPPQENQGNLLASSAEQPAWLTKPMPGLREHRTTFCEKLWNGLPEEQRVELAVPGPAGSPISLRLFYSKDQKSIQRDTDMLVNAANGNVGNGSGICGAIWKLYSSKKGWKDTPTCKANSVGTLTPGQVFSHEGPGKKNGTLSVIQAFGPKHQENHPLDLDASRLTMCYQGVMREAMRMHCEAITLCNISTDIYKFPRNIAAGIAVSAVANTLRDGDFSGHSGRPIYVWFAQFGDQSIAFYKDAFQALKSESIDPSKAPTP